MALPTAERPPGIPAPWLGVWRHALKVMQEQGTWDWALRPLLDEYVNALMRAEAYRDGLAWVDTLALQAEIVLDDPEQLMGAIRMLTSLAAGQPAQWDRAARRAMALADQLVLTPKAQKAHGLLEPEGEADLDGFDALAKNDELAARRAS